MPAIRHTDQLKIAAVCFAGALVNAALAPIALMLFAIVPPLGVILLAITAALAPILLCTSIGFLIRWALLIRRART
ncbi:fumarate reductase subunit D [Rhodococcus sp. LBL1]|nr:fumarate reductase subunit D [Rhodococcus sp. LBL1]MDH6684426.1 fumarate reductase subunit D [Rhodococcus sp. LBL2]